MFDKTNTSAYIVQNMIHWRRFEKEVNGEKVVVESALRVRKTHEGNVAHCYIIENRVIKD